MNINMRAIGSTSVLGIVAAATSLACRSRVDEVTAAFRGDAPVGGWSLDRLVADAAACAAVIAVAGLVAAVAYALLAELITRSRRLPTPTTGRARRPRWQSTVLALCGIGLAASPAPPSWAADTGTAPTGCHDTCFGSLSGLRLPELPLSTPRPTVVVRSGDSLWTIAERLVDPRASDTEVARTVVRLIDLNHELVGSNPDLIFPGTELITPGGTR